MYSDIYYKRIPRRNSKEILLIDPDKQYFADNYSCWPPPVFIPTVTFLEVSLFLAFFWSIVFQVHSRIIKRVAD